MSTNTSNKHNQSDDQLDLIARTVVDNSQKIDRIEEKVLEHDDRLDLIEQNMVTREDHLEVMNTLDEILGLVKKNDQELTFMGERVKRVEEDVATMKPMVGFA